MHLGAKREEEEEGREVRRREEKWERGSRTCRPTDVHGARTKLLKPDGPGVLSRRRANALRACDRTCGAGLAWKRIQARDLGGRLTPKGLFLFAGLVQFARLQPSEGLMLCASAGFPYETFPRSCPCCGGMPGLQAVTTPCNAPSVPPVPFAQWGVLADSAGLMETGSGVTLYPCHGKSHGSDLCWWLSWPGLSPAPRT